MSYRIQRAVMLVLALGTAFVNAAAIANSSSAVETASRGRFIASSDAGTPTNFSFPPAVTNTGLASLFPSDIGFPGPTPTGDEAFAIQTAPAVSLNEQAFPLLPPSADRQDISSNGFNPLHSWGSLSPWHSLSSSGFGINGAKAIIPQGCELVQAHLVHRHGARYPSGTSVPAQFAQLLHQTVVNGTGFTGTGKLAFLNDWTFKLGAEILTPFGREQLYDLGVGFRVKYGDLLKNFTGLPVFRTTSQDRMLHSALQFTAGFFGIPFYQTDYHQSIIIESGGFNNTLAPYETCTNSDGPLSTFGPAQAEKWVQKFLAPTVKRLQKDLKGVKLTQDIVLAMLQTCSYETVSLGYSKFCELFTQEEFEGYEYWWDLTFWYTSANGAPYNAAMGIGWVQEFVARVTQTPIATHNSTTNSTLDDSQDTFPLNQSIYVDATHDTIVAAFLVALNFSSFARTGPLPTDHIPKNRSYIVSEIAPFSTNLVGQVLSCPSKASKASSVSSNSSTTLPGTHIRWILNDAVIPPAGVQGCDGSEKDGLCPLDVFVHAMKQRIQEVDFAFDCLANYTVADPASIIDGRPPKSVRPPVVSAKA